MKPWVRKIIPVEETTQDRYYFIAMAFGVQGQLPSYQYWSEGLNGKQEFTVKPGIGLHFKGGPGLISNFKKNEKIKLIAIEIPDDWEKRWRKRKKNFRRKRHA